jgi:tRNA nucleotidyltransferase/poly(A) polymerase
MKKTSLTNKQIKILQSSKYYKDFVEIKKCLNDVFIVGGFVRDLVLNQKSFDIDLATSLSTKEIISALKNYKLVTDNEKFGTIVVNMNKFSYEITSYRIDNYTDDSKGRYECSVSYTNNQAQDALRRDFTINALYMNNEYIFDHLNSFKSLNPNVKVLFIGDPNLRIKEDYIRILRYFRFVAKYNLKCDPSYIKIFQSHKDGLKETSTERINKEIVKIIKSKNYYSLYILCKYQILNNAYEAIDFEFIKYFLILKNVRIEIILMFLIKFNTTKDIKIILNKMRFSNAIASRLINLLKALEIFCLNDFEYSSIKEMFNSTMCKKKFLLTHKSFVNYEQKLNAIYSFYQDDLILLKQYIKIFCHKTLYKKIVKFKHVKITLSKSEQENILQQDKREIKNYKLYYLLNKSKN